MRLLGRHDAGDARRAQHVALLGVAVEDHLQRLRPHRHEALGDRRALVSALSPTSTISRFARRAEMGEARSCHASGGLVPAPCRVRSRRVAASTSSCRIRLSPTRKVPMPARASRRQSSWREDAALADQQPVARHHRRQPLGGFERWSRRCRRSRLLMPISCELQLQRALQSRPRHALRPARPCRARTRSSSSARGIASSRLAMMSRMASAPQARASSTW